MKNVQTSEKNRLRIWLFFLITCCLFAALALRMGWNQVINGEKYSRMATNQQTKDSIVAAVRGDIVDRNGNQLAISATANTIWIRTASVRGNGKTDAEVQGNMVSEARTLAALLDMEEDDVMSVLSSDKALVRLKKYVDNDTAKLVRDEQLAGVEIVEGAKRYYPLGSFASQLIGTTNDDNEGLTGLELQYNSYLSGLNGRWISNRDGARNSLPYGVNKYYAAEDGSSLQLTIDENIQYIVMQKISSAKITTNADRVMCMMMDPKTGDVLAMAQTGEYDPNDPRRPADGDENLFAMLTADEQVAYWNKLWRNFCICDVYEPGSTFKLITTSIALDRGVTHLGETFTCYGTLQVADYLLKCWYYPRSHGLETLEQAVENSCNPVMIQLAQRLGLTAYYEGLDAFGLTEKTGIDFPGESSNILQNRRTAGPVGLATMSYGQGIAVTPVSLVTAIGSLANGGYLMQPRLVKALLDPDGNVVESYDPVIKSRSVSKQTAEDVLSIMEMVVSEGGGGNAKVPGYRIGGKTGTANKPEGGGYSDTDVYASFIGVAPIDDPKFVILVIVDTPRGVLYGSSTAAPCAKEIMQEVLKYLDVTPQYTEEQQQAMDSKKISVPDVTGKSAEDALGVLGGRGLKGVLSPATEVLDNIVITDQYPKGGAETTRRSEVTLYYEITEGTGGSVGGASDAELNSALNDREVID